MKNFLFSVPLASVSCKFEHDSHLLVDTSKRGRLTDFWTTKSTSAISVIRLQVFGSKPPADFTFDHVTITSWSIGELGCGIVCVCLPTLRPLVSKHLPTGWTEQKMRPISGAVRFDSSESVFGGREASSRLELARSERAATDSH
jgi:hypothetical protein